MQVLLGNCVAPTLRDDFMRSARRDGRLEILSADLDNFVSREGFARIPSAPTQPFVFLQSTATVGEQSANDHTWQLVEAIDNAQEQIKDADGKRRPAWVIAPFLGYARQDRRKAGSGDSVALKTFGTVMKSLGVVGVSTVEIHSNLGMDILKDEELFGPSNVYNLDPTKLIVKEVKRLLHGRNYSVGGPDAGGKGRARRMALALMNALNLDAVEHEFEKEHESVNKTKIVGFKGDVKGRVAVTIDDMVDTGGTMINSQERLADEGAAERIVVFPHPVLSNGGFEKMYVAKKNGSYLITQFVMADTIDVGLKLAALKSRFGNEQVDRRVKLLHTSDIIYSHVKHDLLKHPAMQL